MQHERPALKLAAGQAQAFSEEPDGTADCLPVPAQSAAHTLLEVAQVPGASRPDVGASHHRPRYDRPGPGRDGVIR